MATNRNTINERLKELIDRDLINEIPWRELEEYPRYLQLERESLIEQHGYALSSSELESFKQRYTQLIDQYTGIVTNYNEYVKELDGLLCELETEVICDLRGMRTEFLSKLLKVWKEFENVQSNNNIDVSFKQGLTDRYNIQVERFTNEYINSLDLSKYATEKHNFIQIFGQIVIDKVLPAEYRDSIYWIEKTLEEPELYTLPTLTMWRETAEQKIQKIKNRSLPKGIEIEIVSRYEFLLKQLRAEILKLRTYPIPEPWCSRAMRVGMTHLIEGEFIFFIHPGIEEDMRPLNLTERETQPGGITRQEYDTRLNRMDRDMTLAIKKLETRNVRKIDWFEEVKNEVNFAFTELLILYRDIRSLEFLVDRNQDDKLLKGLYDIILRIIRHYHDNRIDIPSVAIDTKNEPIRISPPKAERNIPVASGIDRGAASGYQLVTPAAVLVVNNTVIVADKYGHLVSWYRASDLTAYGSNPVSDTPVSLAVYKDMLYVCYSEKLVEFSFSWESSKEILSLHYRDSIIVPEMSCLAPDKDSFSRLNTAISRIIDEAATLSEPYSYGSQLDSTLETFSQIYTYISQRDSKKEILSQMYKLIRQLAAKKVTLSQIYTATYQLDFNTESLSYICRLIDQLDSIRETLSQIYTLIKQLDYSKASLLPLFTSMSGLDYIRVSLSQLDSLKSQLIASKDSLSQLYGVSCLASNSESLFVGTLRPSIIHIHTNTLSTGMEYPLYPIRYDTEKSRFPWLQDMKATENNLICLFTGSPSPLQLFSLYGHLLKSILREHHIVGAYHFALYKNPIINEWRIYVADFWDNSLKVFNMNGRFIETFSEKGFGLGQIYHPTGIFVESSGYITVCDMKEENCLQRL